MVFVQQAADELAIAIFHVFSPRTVSETESIHFHFTSSLDSRQKTVEYQLVVAEFKFQEVVMLAGHH